MRAIRKFDEFIKENIVKKQAADRSRAEFLIKESENSYKNLLEMIEKLKLEYAKLEVEKIKLQVDKFKAETDIEKERLKFAATSGPY